MEQPTIRSIDRMLTPSQRRVRTWARFAEKDWFPASAGAYNPKTFELNGVATSVADDTMDRKSLAKFRRELEVLRNSQPKATSLQRFAQRVGRSKENRGKHPMYGSEAFPHLRPLSIPNHKGRDLPLGTKNSILNQLEEDLDAWDAALSRQGHGNGGNGSQQR